MKDFTLIDFIFTQSSFSWGQVLCVSVICICIGALGGIVYADSRQQRH